MTTDNLPPTGKHRGEAPKPMDGADLLMRWDAHRTGAAPTPNPPARSRAARVGVPHPRDGAQSLKSSVANPKAVYDFPPPRWPRILLGLAFVVSAVLAVPAVLTTIRDTNDYNVGISLALTAFALIFWWGMLGASQERIRILSGVVEVSKGKDLHRFDLRDKYQQVHMFGTPDSPRWKVAFERPGESAYLVTGRMVRAKEFTQAVEVYRGPLYPH